VKQITTQHENGIKLKQTKSPRSTSKHGPVDDTATVSQ